MKRIATPRLVPSGALDGYLDTDGSVWLIESDADLADPTLPARIQALADARRIEAALGRGDNLFLEVQHSNLAFLTKWYVADRSSEIGALLDLTAAVETFSDQFTTPTVTDETGAGPWFAPVHGGYGNAGFTKPQPGLASGEYLLGPDALTIHMNWDGTRWATGNIQTAASDGRAWAQKYGIFEMRAKFPAGHGNWPAFWLKSANQFTDPTKTRCELDVVEAYGSDLNGHHSTVHLWPAAQVQPGDPAAHWQAGAFTRVTPQMFDGNFHVYTMEVTPARLIVYYDRKRIASYPLLPEFQVPLFMLCTLAYYPGDAKTDTLPADLVIDYVKAWQRPEWAAL